MTKVYQEYMIFLFSEIWLTEIYKLILLFNKKSERFPELTCSSSMKHSKTILLMRYDNNIYWTADINMSPKKFNCYICNHLFDRSYNLLVHMKNCSKKTRHKYLSGDYQLSEPVFDRLEDLNIIVPLLLSLFLTLFFCLESITVPDKTQN